MSAISTSTSTPTTPLLRADLFAQSNAVMAANEKYVIAGVQAVLNHVQTSDVPRAVYYIDDTTLECQNVNVKVVYLWLSEIFHDCRVQMTLYESRTDVEKPGAHINVEWDGPRPIFPTPIETIMLSSAFVHATDEATRTPILREQLLQDQFLHTSQRLAKKCADAVTKECTTECAFTKKYFKQFIFGVDGLKCFEIMLSPKFVETTVQQKLAEVFPDCELNVKYLCRYGINIEIDWNTPSPPLPPPPSSPLPSSRSPSPAFV